MLHTAITLASMLQGANRSILPVAGALRLGGVIAAGGQLQTFHLGVATNNRHNHQMHKAFACLGHHKHPCQWH